MLRSGAIQGWIRPIHVSGPSMIPTLWGPSDSVTCSGCGITIRYTSQIDRPGPLLCSNCGSPLAKADSREIEASRILIDRAAYWCSSPSRHDVICLRDSSGTLVTKRILGLPGEQLEFVDGDVFASGDQITKPLSQILDRAISVYNDHFRNEQHSRWVPDSGSTWKTSDHGFQISDSVNVHRLVYRHENVYRGGRREPVMDDCPANRGISRHMNPAADLILCLRCVAALESSLAIRLVTPNGMAKLTFARTKGRWSIESGSGKATLPGGNNDELIAAHIDGRQWVGCNGSYVDLGANAPTGNAFSGNRSQPIVIDLLGSIEISNIEIARDIVYFGDEHIVQQGGQLNDL